MRTAFGALAVCGLLAVAWAAERTSYLTDDPYHRDVVLIVSDAPMAFILTRTPEVHGTIDIDPENILAEPKARFDIDASRLTTGVATRDELLRGAGWLNVNEFPKITFELKEVRSPTRPTGLVPGRPQAIDVIGTLTLHGQAHERPAALTITYLPADDETAQRLPGDLLRIDARFDLLLSDFGIEIPAAAAAAVANRQQVAVHLFASTQRLVPPAPAE